MAQKRITDLQLIDEITETINFPLDDGIQTYRATGAQMKKFCTPWINVKDYGATGDGVTDDTVAINLAFADAEGKRVFFPSGTYIVSDTDTAYSTLKYATIFDGTDIEIEGEGDSSVIQIDAHENYCALINVMGASGKVSIRNLKLAAPTRANTTHNGPMGIDYGELGVTTGTITEIEIDNVSFENMSFFVHGQGAKYVRIKNCRGNIQGGGTYPTYFSEAINLGSAAGHSYRTLVLEITDNIIAHDGTYDDHGIYTLGPIDQIIIERNYHSVAPKDGLYKIDYGTGTPTFEYISISNNTTTTLTSTEGFIVFSGTATLSKCRIVGNRTNACGRFIDSEWAFKNIEVIGNYARDSQYRCVSLTKNAGLSVMGVCVISGNDFNGYNSVADSSIGVTAEAFLYVTMQANNITSSGSSAGTCINVNNHSLLNLFGNFSDKTPTQLSGGNFLNTTSHGNSWDNNHYMASAVPAAQAHAKGEVVWNNSPDNFEPAFWVCTVAGTPGTWVNGPILNGPLFPKTNLASNTDEGFGAGIFRTLDVSTKHYIHFTGTTAIDLQGMAAGTDGQIVKMYNTTGQNMTIRHNSANPTAVNKIYTPALADVVSTSNSTCEFIYDTTESRWVLLSYLA